MLLLLLLPPSFCLGVMDAADDHGSSVKIQDPVSFSCQPPVNLLHFGGSHQALCIQKSHRGVPIKKASASLGHPNPRGFQVVFLDGRAAQVLCHYLIDYKQCWLLPCFVLPSQFSLPARKKKSGRVIAAILTISSWISKPQKAHGGRRPPPPRLL